jgi:30S ribosomal protein S31
MQNQIPPELLEKIRRHREVRIMGKGDKRSRRGKIWRGTTGKARPRTQKKVGVIVDPAEPVKKARK